MSSDHSRKKSAITCTSEESGLSRREMMGTLGLGLLSLPSLVSAGLAEINPSTLEPEERIIPLEERNLIEMQTFIEDCIKANKETDSQEAVKEVLARGVRDHAAMLKTIGDPTEAGLKVFLRSKEFKFLQRPGLPK